MKNISYFYLIFLSVFLLFSCVKDDNIVEINDENKIEIRAPRNGNTVPVCHVLGNGNTQTIYVNQNAVKAHLAHGDSEGECTDCEGYLCEFLPDVDFIDLDLAYLCFEDVIIENACGEGLDLAYTFLDVIIEKVGEFSLWALGLVDDDCDPPREGELEYFFEDHNTGEVVYFYDSCNDDLYQPCTDILSFMNSINEKFKEAEVDNDCDDDLPNAREFSEKLDAVRKRIK